MIFVGDARKGGLGLGFEGGGGGRRMEETELEEGEACSYRNDNGDYDASVDPDIALSYIDEKLQNVLGHFQKDFEGGVSAENLGAKFGGYGSFLPAYPRSPVHPRTSPKVQNFSIAGSPDNRLLEGGQQNSLVSSNASQPVRVELTSTSSTSLPVLKAPSKKDSFKLDIAEEVTPRYESENQRLTNLSDQKTLKVRIKVGSDNLSTRKNAAIYSGLGLDVSPSSSLNDSPSGSEGMSREPQDIPFESPTTILQIMTSFPVPGDTLLSPLSHNLIHLTKKEKLMKVYTSMPVSRDGLESTNTIPYGPDSRKVGGKVVGEKKMKSLKRSDVIAELKSDNCKDAQKGNGLLSRKEPDIDILACEEPVSKNLKLSLLSNSNSAVGGMEKGKDKASDISREADKGLLKDKDFSDLAEEDHMGPTFSQENGFFEKSKAGSAGKVSEDNRESSLDDIPVFPRKAAQPNGEMSSNSVKSDSKVSKGTKALNTELTDPFKENPNQKGTVYEQDSMRLAPEKEHSFSGSKKKSNGSQSNGTLAVDVPKVSLRVGSSSVSKTKKSTHADHHTSKSEFEDFKIQKDLGTAGDRYRDFFGELEEEENEMDSLEVPSEDKDCEVVEKSISAINNALGERSSVKKFDKLSVTDTYPKAEPNIGPYSGNRPISDAAPAMGAPSVMELDTWVSCDRCHKWRLLPFPKDLPEKWLCSMLDWLPGMNRCSVAEEETTKALIALHQIPAPESQTNLHGNPGGVLTGAMLANVRRPDQNHQNIGSDSMPWGGQKKDGLTEAPDVSYKDGLSQLSNSVKKNLQASVKDRSLNDVNQSPDSQQLSKSSDLPVKKHKEKQKVRHSYSEGGYVNNLKMKRIRDDSDLDCSRASRKMKTEGTDEDGMLDHSEPARKIGPSSSNGFPAASEKDQARYSERFSFKDSRNGVNDGPHVSVKNAKHKFLVSLDGGSLETGNSDSRESSEKRKGKDEFNDDDYRKEKKVRVSKSEGKESRASRDSGRTDKKGGQAKNQQLEQDPGSNLSQRSLDGVDSLRRDLGSLQPSMAATSSSSKVSGSHKTKASFQEVKGSPVESVSSSPMRISNTDKLTSESRDIQGKDDLQDAGPFALGSPRNCSYGEDDNGSGRPGTARKEKAFNIASHRSFGSTGPDFQERDFCHISGGKARPHIVPSPVVANPHCADGGVYNFGQDTPNPSKPPSSNQCHDEERKTDSPCAHESRPRKSGKGSSSLLKDKNRIIRNEFDIGKVKIPQSLSDVQDDSTSHEVKPRDDKNDFQEKFGIKFKEAQNKYVAKKDPAKKLLSESSKRESQLKCEEHDGSHTKVDSICRQDVASTTKQTLLQDSDGERSSKRFPSDRTDQIGLVSGREKSLPLPPSRGSQIETVNRCPRPVTGSHNANGIHSPAVVASESDAALMAQKQARKADHQNGTQHNSSRNPAPNGQKARELDAPSPARRDSSSQAATNALKEATDLKHCADRLKNSGSSHESTGFYFEAALKFLYGASLLESGSCESSKHSEMIQSKQVYSSTAKLCDFCAHEYEKLKDMAAAALAYKCMEVAYLRVIYFSQTSASRDRHELQTALQMVPPGESPSSSASDLDNLNNPTTVDKVTLCKGVSSPQVAGSHAIAARSRPNFMRLLNFAQDVNFAMEASRKSRIAFTAASVSLGETESISSIKRALDFNFQDVEGFLRLVRLAMEAISR
ncbi:hypothetical protein I3760_07G102100 [Carya illinoinensis]|nr:hypothetical protein I3760_07G102100 [Carya illinoinensis]KAG2697357.1 hypothetical protein I3760_07G102100 [Carya illinoinensis]KAG2697358.1 hypothetical protein I3760_07G102100 [Carya illinoinensis]KAG2697359.1 hypothetical protein I3760_07G102100 [Carya illinoinensis]KAG2697360.1 hypothetical protein I3760_07G102100 [Carya illinoinensis]